MIIDIYDFDKTVFPKDSTTEFWKFCMKKNPKLLRFVPHELWTVIVYFVKGKDLTYLKGEFLCFIKGIDVEAYANEFWEKHISEINEWFLPENRENPAVVISASPEFLLKSACEKLKVEKLIATKTNSDGKIIGKNCKGEEKVKRLNKEMSDYTVKKTFTDSLKNDKWILNLAEEKYQVIKKVAVKIQVGNL